MDNLLERWPGYDEQSWSERFAELDRQYRETTTGAIDACVALSAEIEALNRELAEARSRALREAKAIADDESKVHGDAWHTATTDEQKDRCSARFRTARSIAYSIANLIDSKAGGLG